MCIWPAKGAHDFDYKKANLYVKYKTHTYSHKPRPIATPSASGLGRIVYLFNHTPASYGSGLHIQILIWRLLPISLCHKNEMRNVNTKSSSFPTVAGADNERVKSLTLGEKAEKTNSMNQQRVFGRRFMLHWGNHFDLLYYSIVKIIWEIMFLKILTV